MANIIKIGSSNRLVDKLNTTNSAFVFKNKTSRTIGNTSVGPIQSYSTSNETISSKFVKNSNAIYKENPTKYENSYGFLPIGPKQPFVSVNPNSSTRRIKRYDSRAFPIGSVIQDTQRIAKFTVTTKGILNLGKQFLLQNLNTYNETKIYNPLSVLQSTIRPTTLGLLPRSKRHIDISGGILGGLASAAGIGNSETKAPPGTSADISGNSAVLSRYALSGTKGLIRPNTGASARTNLLSRVGPNKDSKSGGFLSKLASGLINSFVPGLFSKPANQFKGVDGSIKYRADQDAYDIYRNNLDQIGKMNGFQQKYFGTDGDFTSVGYAGRQPENGYTEQVLRDDAERKTGDKISEQYEKIKYDDFSSNSPLNSGYQIKNTNRGYKQGTYSSVQYNDAIKSNFNIQGEVQIDTEKSLPLPLTYVEQTDINNQIKKRNNQNPDLNRTLVTKGFPTVKLKNVDAITVRPIDDKNPIESRETADQIKFWFKDEVNGKYLVFRATVSGINDSSNVTWDSIKYLGQPDSLYGYSGYERTLSFSFRVYCNSVRELIPMWKKINYLKSFSHPSKYQYDSQRTNSGFMVAPLIKLTLGDMYNDLPVAINNIGVTIPEESSWETLSATRGDYDYGLYSLVKVEKDGLEYGQLPMIADIIVSMNVFETSSRPKIGSEVFGSIKTDENTPVIWLGTEMMSNQ